KSRSTSSAAGSRRRSRAMVPALPAPVPVIASRPMTDLRRRAEQLGLSEKDYVQHGDGVGKLNPSVAFLDDQIKLPGKLVLVSAINPTPAGEGKTTISIGLADGLRARGVGSVPPRRQPSLGPTLGSKGGGAGGGNSRLEPFERVNLG